MSLLTTNTVRQRARKATPYNFSAGNVLEERIRKQSDEAGHDIFLSHAFDDKELILGVALVLEDLGYSVYLDWRDDPSLDRKSVNRITALRLRERLRLSKALFFATSENASHSKWMPWELGYKDGDNKKSAILPIMSQTPDNYKGQEYLGIYPYITQQKSTQGGEVLWVQWSSKCYVQFDAWLAGKEPYER